MVWLRVWLLAGMLMGLGAPVWAQGAAAAGTVEDALRGMSDVADVVFVGEVVGVRRVAGVGGASGVVEVEFRVERAVRGCSGGTYVMREWAGLWAVNEPRYRVGQRRLMLLHGAGPGGMSSPVGGMDGAIPVQGRLGAEEVADLRWVGTRRGRGVRFAGTGTGAMVRAADAGGGAAVAGVETSAPVDAVAKMLGGWESARHAVR